MSGALGENGVRPLQRRGLTPSVRILVAEAEGSVPREAGAVMWVSTDGIEGTIGGGTLEHEAIFHARAILAQGLPEWHRELRAYPLGPALGQCCGGMVRLLFEVATTGAPVGWVSAATKHESQSERIVPRVTQRPRAGVGLRAETALSFSSPFGAALTQPTDLALAIYSITSGAPPVLITDRRHAGDLPVPVLRAVRAMLSGTRPRATLLIRDHIIEPVAQPPHPLYLYGAGHVGRAVVRALADLPFAVAWVDVADDRFPADMPPNAEPIISTDPAAIAAAAPENALHLIMTFSHALDLSLCNAVLERDFAWAGLIGSATKRARFEKRLREAGISDAALARLACPIGIGGITGKEPAMIAISVAAQLAAWASSGGAVQAESDRHHG
jgi:xanthine dehydrogenase accessory factor